MVWSKILNFGRFAGCTCPLDVLYKRYLCHVGVYTDQIHQMANAIYTMFIWRFALLTPTIVHKICTFGGQTTIKSILLTFCLVWGGSIGFNEYFHMLCGLQLFVGTISRSLVPWWLVGACWMAGLVLLLKWRPWSGGSSGLSSRETNTSYTRVKHVVYNWCGSLKILFL